MAQLVAGDSRRFPDAIARRTASGWTVRLEGVAERVTAREVVPVGDGPAVTLETSIEDAYRHLDRVSRLAAPARAARALATHARCHPVARLLCRHGLPLWHNGPDPCRLAAADDGVAVIGLGPVRAMMTGLRGLEDLAGHVITGSGPASPAQVEAALAWPILPSHLTKPVRAETERDGWLVAQRCRQVVATSLQVLQDTSRLRRDVEWITPDRLQRVTHAHSDLALYVHVLTERLLRLG